MTGFLGQTASPIVAWSLHGSSDLALIHWIWRGECFAHGESVTPNFANLSQPFDNLEVGLVAARKGLPSKPAHR